ncbi:MAG: hypothetical protein D6753_01600, partial [Planctomycetota bacterium]
ALTASPALDIVIGDLAEAQVASPAVRSDDGGVSGDDGLAKLRGDGTLDDTSHVDDRSGRNDDVPGVGDESNRDDSSHIDDSNRLDDRGGRDDAGVNSNELRARFPVVNGVAIEAKHEAETKAGQARRKFEVEIHGAAPGATFDVVVDGVAITTLTADALGNARIEYSSVPDANHVPFPADFPAVTAGVAIQVGEASSTFEPRLGDNRGDDNPGDDNPGDDDRPTVPTTPPSPGALTPIELEAHFQRINGVRLKAKYEVENEHGGWKRELKFEIKDAPANTSFDVVIAGAAVTTVTTDSRGRAKVKFSSQPDGDALPLPADLPAIEVGTPITIGAVSSTFQLDD